MCFTIIISFSSSTGKLLTTSDFFFRRNRILFFGELGMIIMKDCS